MKAAVAVTAVMKVTKVAAAVTAVMAITKVVAAVINTKGEYCYA